MNQHPKPPAKDDYQIIARVYDALEPLNRALRQRGLTLWEPQSGMAVLDVGCGTGSQLAMYQKYGCRLHGIDTSPAMLRRAEKRLGGQAELRLADAGRLPWGPDSFDLVICMLALHEMTEEKRGESIPEMKRVLKDGGHLLFIDFHAGQTLSLRGRVGRLCCYLLEFAAGKRHFRNFRNFLARGGLPAIIKNNGLFVVAKRIVGGGTFALYLLKKSPEQVRGGQGTAAIFPVDETPALR